MDAQPALFDLPRWTVSDLTRHLSEWLESNPELQDLWVEGEISNFSRPASGHVYFTLKDSSAQLRCVMWRNDAARLRFAPSDGMAVEAHGRISIYAAGGQYQLYADLLRPVGEGTLFQEFLRLRTLLEAEGLFDPARKRLIPELARRIGIVTSPTGAALRDMLNTLRRRNPLAEVVLAPSPVQGEEAPPALVEAIQTINRVAAPDVILLARGGGSIEDLWAFNDERVVRAIVASQAPVITGVGHETDFTLADFAADLRAPTPTAAAEMATAITVDDMRLAQRTLMDRLVGAMRVMLEARRGLVEGQADRMLFSSPLRRVQSERQRLDDISRRVHAVQAHRLALDSARLKGLESRLLALGPLAVLQRGYAVVSRKTDGKVVSSARSVTSGEALNVRVQDGGFDVSVTGNQ
jgi:exodeoxyribonuclease VII large subunit